ncbi:Hypothetical predicted protein [Lecanosticta acicola]|uniref:Uncharacterized protein n=1 Tax=Lecanosticta acicola TaxID=111012 RepID=A0AAI8Z2X6_9PEZI|nr:Hypothetical predicted protein [Lecanosticta acicola]
MVKDIPPSSLQPASSHYEYRKYPEREKKQELKGIKDDTWHPERYNFPRDHSTTEDRPSDDEDRLVFTEQRQKSSRPKRTYGKLRRQPQHMVASDTLTNSDLNLYSTQATQSPDSSGGSYEPASSSVESWSQAHGQHLPSQGYAPSSQTLGPSGRGDIPPPPPRPLATKRVSEQLGTRLAKRQAVLFESSGDEQLQESAQRLMTRALSKGDLSMSSTQTLDSANRMSQAYDAQDHRGAPPAGDGSMGDGPRFGHALRDESTPVISQDIEPTGIMPESSNEFSTDRPSPPRSWRPHSDGSFNSEFPADPDMEDSEPDSRMTIQPHRGQNRSSHDRPLGSSPPKYFGLEPQTNEAVIQLLQRRLSPTPDDTGPQRPIRRIIGNPKALPSTAYQAQIQMYERSEDSQDRVRLGLAAPDQLPSTPSMTEHEFPEDSEQYFDGLTGTVFTGFGLSDEDVFQIAAAEEDQSPQELRSALSEEFASCANLSYIPSSAEGTAIGASSHSTIGNGFKPRMNPGLCTSRGTLAQKYNDALANGRSALVRELLIQEKNAVAFRGGEPWDLLQQG